MLHGEEAVQTEGRALPRVGTGEREAVWKGDRTLPCLGPVRDT